MMNRINRYWKIATCLLFVICAKEAIAQEETMVMENRRELFVDDHLLDKIEKLQNKLETPFATGQKVVFDQPWEGVFVTYVSIIKDDKGYKMYYRGKGEYKGKTDEVTCLALSDDGINWIKPMLGLHEVNGTKANNVIVPPNDHQSMHNFTVYYDTNEGVPAEERYKAVGGANHSNASYNGLYRYVSADGIKWNLFKRDTTSLFNAYALDSQNVLLWSPVEQCYVIYLRAWTGNKKGLPYPSNGIRTIARSTSKDFLAWSDPVEMSFDGTEIEHLYTNATTPYFRAPQLLIAMPFRFMPKQRILSDEQLTEFGTDKSQWQGMSDGIFMTSRGGNNYDRKFLKSFIRPGADLKNWSARNNIPALGIFPISDREMSFYVTRNYGTPTVSLERMVLRTDGFASLEADYEEGYAVTKALKIKGNKLLINYASATSGYVKVELLDEDGKPLPGYSVNEASTYIGDEINQEVVWSGGKSVSGLGDKLVKIRFLIKDANLYSFAVLD